MKIECNIYSGQTNGFGSNNEAVLVKFVCATQRVVAYLQISGNINHTEIWLVSGQKCIIDIPFEKFDKQYGRYISDPILDGVAKTYTCV